MKTLSDIGLVGARPFERVFCPYNRKPRAQHCCRAALLALLILLGPTVLANARCAQADSFLAKTLPDLVAEADVIFVGTVARADARRASGLIVTDVGFRIGTVIKGIPATSELVMSFLGGTIGSESVSVAGWPRLEQGETYLAFVKNDPRLAFPVVGGPQGLFRVVSEPTTGEAGIRNAGGRPIDNVSITALVGRTPSLADFLSVLRAELRNGAGH